MHYLKEYYEQIYGFLKIKIKKEIVGEKKKPL